MEASARSDSVEFSESLAIEDKDKKKETTLRKTKQNIKLCSTGVHTYSYQGIP
jgi:hypothetical protein